MKIISTKFSGLKVIQSKSYKDNRGLFKEDYKKKFSIITKLNIHKKFDYIYKNKIWGGYIKNSASCGDCYKKK